MGKPVVKMVVTYLPLFLDMFSVQQQLLAKSDGGKKNKIKNNRKKLKQNKNYTHSCKGEVYICGSTRDFDMTLDGLLLLLNGIYLSLPAHKISLMRHKQSAWLQQTVTFHSCPVT